MRVRVCLSSCVFTTDLHLKAAPSLSAIIPLVTSVTHAQSTSFLISCIRSFFPFFIIFIFVFIFIILSSIPLAILLSTLYFYIDLSIYSFMGRSSIPLFLYSLIPLSRYPSIHLFLYPSQYISHTSLAGPPSHNPSNIFPCFPFLNFSSTFSFPSPSSPCIISSLASRLKRFCISEKSKKQKTAKTKKS